MREIDLCTALHRAAFLGHDQQVRELLKHKADPFARNFADMTPLHYAAGRGLASTTQLLVEAQKNDPSAPSGWADEALTVAKRSRENLEAAALAIVPGIVPGWWWLLCGLGSRWGLVLVRIMDSYWYGE